MGKDQELLEGARCGNYAVVERILNQRARKSGPLASLRRGPGPNIQDGSGYTPLHHACLNGHEGIVALLLSHDASSNIVDHKGCTPLHLASWSGNAEIVELLLKHGPCFQYVNHMNFDHESALHSAAQYGHTAIVKMLIENKCYPSVRNVRNESPLDLASQYGRLETVECLLNAHPGLLSDIVRCHFPLHLAAKNGHKHVVKLLLDSGFDINYMTDIGTALHEAAMYGKLEVVKLLLDYGIDPNLENSRKRTVFDILGDLNTTIAKQIDDVIREHMTLIKLDMGSNGSLPILPPQGFVIGSNLESLFPERCSLSGITPPRQFCSPTFDDSLYDVLPPPKPVDSNSPKANDSLISITPSQSQDSCFDQTSCSSGSPSKCESSVYDTNIYQNIDSDSILYEIPPPPSFFSNKRYSDPSQQSSIYQNVSLSDKNEEKDVYDSSSWALQRNSYVAMLPSNSCVGRSQAPAKPPRKSVSPQSSETKSIASQRKSYEFLCLATTGHHDSSSKFLDRNKNNNKEFSYAKPYMKPEYVDMGSSKGPIPTYENHEIICSNGLERKTEDNRQKSSKFSEILPFSLFCEDGFRKGSSFNNLMPSKSTPALHASRHTLDQVIPTISKEFPPTHLIVNKRASVHFPSSPTNYNQPPTPDNPPPSPKTAEIGIHEKIHPVGQLKKQVESRDIETLTDEQLVATLGPHGEVELTLATDNKCVSTDGINYRNPFAGLQHGSVSAIYKNESPVFVNQFRKVYSKSHNIYENVRVAMDEDNSKVVLSMSDSGVHTSCGLSVMSPFDEKAEWAEIAGIVASFGGSITSRESSFAQDIESPFAQSFKTDSSISDNSFCYNSLEQWLSYLGLSQYENLLVISGFDDIKFLGGNIIEEVDLQEIGICNAFDRHKLCSAAQKLPSIKPITSLTGAEKYPQSINEWLKSLNLLEYNENFFNNNITDMNRASKLWEVELNTVLKISKLGHRKRILASLGDKHFGNFIDPKELDLSKLTLDLSELEVADGKKDSSIKENISVDHSNNHGSDTVSKPYFRIRSPTQLMSDSQNPGQNAQHCLIEAQWRHHPDELVMNSCNYVAKYLGSTLVKELYGLESTKMSIQKLKASTRDIAKIPSIILSISYSGVKFINAETQQLVCEHEIRNIHCACQDAEDLRHFAYITKEHQTHNHYCHVFSSHTVELASEIILTLGQAFEVAYQMAMKEKAERACNTGKKDYILSNVSS